jgi:hypothetical protein
MSPPLAPAVTSASHLYKFHVLLQQILDVCLLLWLQLNFSVMIQLQSLSHRLSKNKSISFIQKPVLWPGSKSESVINWPPEILKYGCGWSTVSLPYIKESKKF